MNQPLRILHAVCTDEFAGVEQFILTLAVAQATAGHEVSVAGGDPTRMRAALAAAGIRFASVSSVTAVARAIRARRNDVDVVNTHMTAADAAGILALAGARSRPALVSTRHFAKRRGNIVPLDSLLRPHFDAEISISRYVAQSIGVPSIVVHPGIEARPNVGSATREPVVLMAQRLQPEKHSVVGVRAFAASGLAADGWTLEIAGDGPDRLHAERLAEELAIAPAVRFLGFRDDVDRLMTRASILLATCPVEGFGLTVLEAMASGLPVIVPDSGGPCEILGGLDERALYRSDDAAHAGSRLRSLADDDAGRIAFGAAARRRQRADLTAAEQALSTIRVYRRISNRPRVAR